MKEGQPYGCPSLLLDQTLDQNDQNDDGQDELEVGLEGAGHLQTGAGVGFFQILVEAPAPLGNACLLYTSRCV